MAVLSVNRENFDTILNSEKTVLLDFYADWCGPCRMVSPIVDEIAEQREDIHYTHTLPSTRVSLVRNRTSHFTESGIQVKCQGHENLLTIVNYQRRCGLTPKGDTISHLSRMAKINTERNKTDQLTTPSTTKMWSNRNP